MGAELSLAGCARSAVHGLAASEDTIAEAGPDVLARYSMLCIQWKCGLEFAPFPVPQVFQASMPTVKVKENEPFDVALRRFKHSCEKAGVLSEVRRREYYEKPTSVRKRKQAAAVKRHLKKLQREQKKLERTF